MYFLLSNASCEFSLSGAMEQWTGVPAQCIRANQDHVMIASAFVVKFTAVSGPCHRRSDFSSCGGSVRRDSPDEDCVSMAVDLSLLSAFLSLFFSL